MYIYHRWEMLASCESFVPYCLVLSVMPHLAVFMQ